MTTQSVSLSDPESASTGKQGQDTEFPNDPPDFEGLPDIFCNLVMKGGVTSGVVFPGAIRVLATHYRFRHIGGTSAGAIAAAFTAVAEYRRREGILTPADHTGFDTIWDQGDDLSLPPQKGQTTSAGTRLEALFAPNHSTQKMYALMAAIAGVEAKTKQNLDKAVSVKQRRGAFASRLLGVVLKNHPLPTGMTGLGAALLVGGAAWWLGTRRESGPVALMLAGTWMTGGGLALLVKSTLIDGLQQLNQNGFGLSKGFELRSKNEPERFTEWMHRNIQQIAGFQSTGKILTFGHLSPKRYNLELDPEVIFDHSVPRSQTQRDRLKYGDISLDERRLQRQYIASDIDLKQVTTNLTFGRPYTFPLTHSNTDDRNFYFKESELREFFPAEIVVHLMNYSEMRIELRTESEPYLRLPQAQDLPVLVSTRMSMSFPGLFAPIPLYYASWIHQPNNPAELYQGQAFKRVPTGLWKNIVSPSGRAHVERVYFGDGGLTSNFPLGLFDDLIPDEITFGLDLASHKNPVNVQTGQPIIKNWGSSLILRPVLLKVPGERDRDGNNTWTPGRNTFDSLFGYGLAILESARNWSDNALMSLPGYTERIAHINVSGNLGGTNLAMNATQIEELRRRGMTAGYRLFNRFSGAERISYSGPTPQGWTTNWSWETHRTNTFVRLTADLESLLLDYALAYKDSNANRLDPQLERNLNEIFLQNQVPFILLPNGIIPGINKINQLINFSDLPTQLRGYQKLRGKRSFLKYRSNF